MVDLDEQDEKALNVALNKIQGGWDNNKLSEILVELKDLDYDLELTGFDDVEIGNLLNNDISIPDGEPQPEPKLDSECFIEIYCNSGDLKRIENTLNEWANSATITINISR